MTDNQLATIMQEVDKQNTTKLMQAAAGAEGVLSYCLAHGYIDRMAVKEATDVLSELTEALALIE